MIFRRPHLTGSHTSPELRSPDYCSSTTLRDSGITNGWFWLKCNYIFQWSRWSFLWSWTIRLQAVKWLDTGTGYPNISVSCPGDWRERKWDIKEAPKEVVTPLRKGILLLGLQSDLFYWPGPAEHANSCWVTSGGSAGQTDRDHLCNFLFTYLQNVF